MAAAVVRMYSSRFLGRVQGGLVQGQGQGQDTQDKAGTARQGMGGQGGPLRTGRKCRLSVPIGTGKMWSVILPRQ